MKIVLFGHRGQVGWELQRSLAPLGEVISLSRHDTSPYCGDIADTAGLTRTLCRISPHVVVNAAAYTAVDRAESEAARARKLNTEAPGALAVAARDCRAWFVHYSTDYVFDGSGSSPRAEDDPTGPLNVYGQTKLDGEALVRQAGGKHLIFRTSWVFAARGHNFLRTILRLAAERDELTVVDDQHGAPTGADLLADVTAHALRMAAARPELAGTYHVAAAGETTWWEYARHVIAKARAAGAPVRVAEEAIRPVPTTAFATAARRPANSRLRTRKARDAFGLTLPDWRIGVDRALAEILDR